MEDAADRGVGGMGCRDAWAGIYLSWVQWRPELGCWAAGLLQPEKKWRLVRALFLRDPKSP